MGKGRKKKIAMIMARANEKRRLLEQQLNDPQTCDGQSFLSIEEMKKKEVSVKAKKMKEQTQDPRHEQQDPRHEQQLPASPAPVCLATFCQDPRQEELHNVSRLLLGKKLRELQTTVRKLHRERQTWQMTSKRVKREQAALQQQLDTMQRELEKEKAKTVLLESKVEQLESEGEELCCICMEGPAEDEHFRVLKGCGHMFHTRCIRQWEADHSTCPLCRAAL